jgi:hypothetical protein
MQADARAAANPAKSKRRYAGSRICPQQASRLARMRGGQPQPAPLASIRVGFVDPSYNFGVLAYPFLFASSFSGIKLILDHVNL